MIFPRWELRHTADPLDTRAYGGGGDGGAADMRAQEEARQRKVQAAVDTINAKFGVGGTARPTPEQFAPAGGGGLGGLIPRVVGQVTAGPAYDAAAAQWDANATEADRNRALRDAQYGEISSAVRDTAMRDLDRQYSKASQRNTFGLARSGLLGSSVDAESGGELGELYGEGKLKATQAGQTAGADLRSNDEKTRQNLIALAQSGIDTGTAASMAAGQMASAADLARGQVAGSTVGRLFDDMTQAYVTNQVLKARGAGAQPPQASPYSTSVFGPSRYAGRIQN